MLMVMKFKLEMFKSWKVCKMTVGIEKLGKILELMLMLVSLVIATVFVGIKLTKYPEKSEKK